MIIPCAWGLLGAQDFEEFCWVLVCMYAYLPARLEEDAPSVGAGLPRNAGTPLAWHGWDASKS